LTGAGKFVRDRPIPGKSANVRKRTLPSWARSNGAAIVVGESNAASFGALE
jgi:hypothetical protein